MTFPPAAELSKLGYNNDVLVSGRRFHVQTEVSSRDGIVIRSVAVEGGIVKIADSRPHREASDLETVRTAAEAQHQAMVSRVEAGEAF